MEKTKIILLQGLLCFISVTQLSAAQRELLQAGGSARRLDGANSPNLFSSSRETQGDDSLSFSALKKETRTHGTQTEPETLSESALALLKNASKVLRSKCDFSRMQDAATVAVVVSVGLKRLADFTVKNNTRLENLLIATGVLELAVTTYSMTRDGYRHNELPFISALCGGSTYAVFFERKDFTEPYWGRIFSVFTLGSNLGVIAYKALRELKKPSTNTDS
jgi:hypothetical protein